MAATRKRLIKPPTSASPGCSSSPSRSRSPRTTKAASPKVYFGALSPDGQLFDRELIFVGYLNNMPLQIGPQRSDIVIDIRNVLARNRSGSNLRCTTADQPCFDPEDTLFDFLAELNASDTKWL